MNRNKVASRVKAGLQSRIETKRLILRRANEADLEPYCRRIYADPEVMRSLLPARKAVALADARPRAYSNLIGHWERYGFGPWVVISKRDNRLLGHCGLRRWPETEDVEVLYAIERSVWGNGYATEGATASLEAGFVELGLERIVAGVLPDNPASIRVLRKLGMHKWEEREFDDLHLIMYEISHIQWRATNPDTTSDALHRTPEPRR